MGLIKALRNLPEFIRVMRKGEFTGDAVILKSTFGKFEPTPEFKEFIEERKCLIPDFSDVDFTRFPKGSLGEVYLQFMKTQGLTPFRFSGRYLDIMEKNYLPIFYASVHDFIHVLTGYDASFAGEAGVWAFIAAQKVSPQANRANKMAQTLFPLASPHQWRLIRKAGKEGFTIGHEARPALRIDFRSELGNPLDEVRARYNIKATSIDEIAFPRKLL